MAQFRRTAPTAAAAAAAATAGTSKAPRHLFKPMSRITDSLSPQPFNAAIRRTMMAISGLIITTRIFGLWLRNQSPSILRPAETASDICRSPAHAPHLFNMPLLWLLALLLLPLPLLLLLLSLLLLLERWSVVALPGIDNVSPRPYNWNKQNQPKRGLKKKKEEGKKEGRKEGRKDGKE